MLSKRWGGLLHSRCLLIVWLKITPISSRYVCVLSCLVSFPTRGVLGLMFSLFPGFVLLFFCSSLFACSCIDSENISFRPRQAIQQSWHWIRQGQKPWIDHGKIRWKKGSCKCRQMENRRHSWVLGQSASKRFLRWRRRVLPKHFNTNDRTSLEIYHLLFFFFLHRKEEKGYQFDDSTCKWAKMERKWEIENIIWCVCMCTSTR